MGHIVLIRRGTDFFGRGNLADAFDIFCYLMTMIRESAEKGRRRLKNIFANLRKLLKINVIFLGLAGFYHGWTATKV